MIWKRIALWLLANAALPILFPAAILAAISWLNDGTFPIFSLITQLVMEGFYVFSALTLIFSLYEEYDKVKKCVSPLLQTLIVVAAMGTSYMFYTTRLDGSYIDKHLVQFLSIWIGTIITAIFIKYRILNLR